MSTEKYIITGGPGAGKTSVIIGLELQGECVIHEAAVDIIQWYQARGIMKPWTDPFFENQIFRLQMEREKKVSIFVKRCFFDRSPIDGLAYCKFYNKEIDREREEALADLISRKEYKKVFLIEHLGLSAQTAVRPENIETSQKLERFIEKTYQDFGFDVIRIPVDTLENRIQHILQFVEEKPDQLVFTC